MKNKTIYTLNARGHVMLEVVRDHFKVSPRRMALEIQGFLAETERALAQKGIQYSALKTALIPDIKRREIAFVFETTGINYFQYDVPIFRKLLPLFAKESNHSVLVGDYIGENDQQQQLCDAFSESVILARNVTWQHSTQFYVVYVNNLTDKMIETFRAGLAGYAPYAGFADCTYSSRFKIYLSTMLCNSFVKHRHIALMGNPDALDNKEDVNMVGYPFEECGYKCKNIQDDMFGVFLSYKIERPVFKGFEVDSEFSLNAVNPNPMPLKDLEIKIDERKFTYLESEKGKTLKRLGLFDSGISALKELITAKLYSNYIYNMSYDASHNTTRFDVMLEVAVGRELSPFRFLVALEYMPKEKCLRLITLY